MVWIIIGSAAFLAVGTVAIALCKAAAKADEIIKHAGGADE